MKITLSNIRKGCRYLKHYGWKEFKIRLSEKREPDNISYREWLEKRCDDTREVEKIVLRTQKIVRCDDLKVALIVLDIEQNEIDSFTLESIQKQSVKPDKIVLINTVSDYVNELKEDFFVCISNGTILNEHAIAQLLDAILHKDKLTQSGVHWDRSISGASLVYSDCDIEGNRPILKPDFSPHLLESYDYISDIVIFDKEYYELWHKGDYKICGENANIMHMPKILGSVKSKEINYLNVQPANNGTPKVSIIIPNKDEISSLDLCLKSIAKSTYTNYEVIIVENNSTNEETFAFYDSINYLKPDNERMNIKVVKWESDTGFNYSSINNYGIQYATGEYIILLNNDIEIITYDWIEKMLGFCQKVNVGIVGAKLYYPDDTIQHAGIVVGVGGHARGIGANMLTGIDRYDKTYFDKTNVVRDVSAVTAACLMIKKSVFDEVGGFEEYLSVAFNDVDLCLKVRKAGYLIVFNPNVEAYHYESKSRGQEDTEEKVRRFQTEIEYMRTEWNDILRYGDPYYNPGYSRVKNDYSLNGL